MVFFQHQEASWYYLPHTWSLFLFTLGFCSTTQNSSTPIVLVSRSALSLWIPCRFSACHSWWTDTTAYTHTDSVSLSLSAVRFCMRSGPDTQPFTSTSPLTLSGNMTIISQSATHIYSALNVSVSSNLQPRAVIAILHLISKYSGVAALWLL